jgi:hypothetical protein
MNGNVEFIKMNNEQFIADFKILLERINDLLNKTASENQDTSEGGEFFNANLLELKIALEAFDSNAIRNVISNLRHHLQASGANEEVEKILNTILIGDYEEAIALIVSQTAVDDKHGTEE